MLSSIDARIQPDVLIVDDSALVRQLMTLFLGKESGMSVRTAADPFIAMRKIEAHRPDAIVLDLEMPRMDGLTFLRRIMAEDPIPVVICSSQVPDGSEQAIRALQLGAVDVILKPAVTGGESLTRWKELFVDRVTAATMANVRRQSLSRPPARVVPTPLGRVRPIDVAIVIGASTGGTEAVAEILASMPADAPAIVVVQHMPSPFTAAFARRLDSICAIRVREAADADTLEQGTALIAPGNRHLSLVRNRPNAVEVILDEGAPVNRHRPSVDILFNSAARVLGSSAIGVLLTGMGADGANGLLELRKTGAMTIAQDQATSVVFGMPRAAIEAGAAVHVLPLQQIAETLIAASARPKPLARGAKERDASDPPITVPCDATN
jgi:two-component system, chemotaxis family, protein-glutamate methylesterase/glutaminase